MKIYQLIYTSVQHSLSDSAKGLSNQLGLRVYSCSEGVTRENIQEIIRYSLYRMPKKPEIEYSSVPCDPSVPEMFPKIFRTLRLSDGRYAAMRIVYSGVDFKGDRGNHYVHALIFDDVDYSFFPEQYYNSPLFTSCLTERQQNSALVQYLPEAEERRDEMLDKRVVEFAASHRKQVEYLVNMALDLLVDDKLNSLFIGAGTEEEAAMYLVTLKYMLPRDISKYNGISTYEAHLPPDRPSGIVFYGTAKDSNNITPELIRTRPGCLYIDIDDADPETERRLPIFDMDMAVLHRRYEQSRITSVSGFLDWCSTYIDADKPGIGAKLIRLGKSAGDRALKARLDELYKVMDDAAYRDAKFEIAKSLYDNSEKLPSKENQITVNFIDLCVRKMCGGEEYPISESCSKMTEAQAKIIASGIRDYMAKIGAAYDSLTEFNKKSLVEFFALVKHGANKNTWRELFLNDDDMLTTFVSLAAQVSIKGRGSEMFTIPKNWNERDLSELVAYVHASAADTIIEQGCLKYILTYRDEDWGAYGVTISSRSKSQDDMQSDLRRVRRMLTKVGYLPFERGTYEALRTEVRADVSDSMYPLLLSRLLNAYYNWRAAAGRQEVAHDRALKVRGLLEELRDKQPQVYDFIIPKFAIEVVESPGHYHELIVNSETMPESFWNWFIIGYNRCKPDDRRLLIYHRIYLSNKDELSALSMGGQLNEVFRAAR